MTSAPTSRTTVNRDVATAPESTQRPRNRQVVARVRGGPDVLEIVEGPVPEPGRGEVRVRILAAGVSFADLLMREGVHPENPRGPITLGWDLIGEIDALGDSVTGVAEGDSVAALTMLCGYADFICLRPEQLVPVPAGLDSAEAVALVLNYVTAYQMLHRSAEVRTGQQVLVHAAGGGVGTALLQLGRLVGLTMYGTASQRSHEVVSSLGGIHIDYKHVDFVEEIRRQTEEGVDVVFDGVGRSHVWRSFKTLRRGGVVVTYGLTSSLRGGRLAGGPRHRFRGLWRVALYKLATALLPGRRKIRVYSIQRLMWRHPDWFRDDLATLFQLLLDGEIKPLIAARLPLGDVREAHERLAAGSVNGKIVLLCGDRRG